MSPTIQERVNILIGLIVEVFSAELDGALGESLG